ncbi:hypothetical protein FACS1894206_09470 [Deltaproteobacteria bacterium]|nr:hypothetical protein FACS1894206_09470 [Deltaproteobacteria bacterium]
MSCLFMPGLRVKIQPDDITAVGNIGSGYHTSFREKDKPEYPHQK